MCATTSFKRGFAVILALFLLMSLVFSITGCGSGGVDQEIAGEVSDADLVGNRVEAPVEAEYFTANNIDYEIINIDRSEEFTGEYVEITGLKDEKVQNKINTLIKKTVETAMDDTAPPPYRGAQVTVKKFRDADGNLTPAQSSVGADVVGNVNNILSVEIYRNVYYGDINGEYDDSAWFNEVIPLNIDLNTGEELKLQDFFADNVDGLEYINRYVAKKLESYDYDNEEPFLYTDQYNTKLTAPFDGFDEDVNFVFNSSMGSIMIFLDYKTPEFYSGDDGTSYGTIYVPYCEYMGVSEKFMGEESLFTEEKPSYCLINGESDQTLFKTEKDDEDLTEFGDMVNIYRSFSYYEDQDEDFIEYARDIYSKMDEKEDFVSAVKKEIDENGDVSAWLSYSVDCDRIGKYNTITCFYEREIDKTQDDTWETIESDTSTKYISLNPDTGKAMKIDELITAENWKDLLYQAMLDNMKNQEEHMEEDFKWSEDTEEYLRAMIDEINGFILCYDSLELSFKTDPVADAADYIVTDPDDLYTYAAMVRYISYSDIGCENLSIFE